MRQIAIVHHDGAGFAHGNAITVGDFVSLAIGHSYEKGNSFLNGPFQVVSRHSLFYRLLPPFQINSLIKFSKNSWRPLVFAAGSPFLSMYFSSAAKLLRPDSISLPMPLSHEL